MECPDDFAAILPGFIAGSVRSPPDLFAMSQVEDSFCCSPGGRPSSGAPRPKPGLLAMGRPEAGDIGLMRVEPAKVIDLCGQLGTGGQVFSGQTLSR
jgi:hypothetical protein